MADNRMSRRKFLYVGAGIVAVAATGGGYYYLTRPAEVVTPTTTQTVIGSPTPPVAQEIVFDMDKYEDSFGRFYELFHENVGNITAFIDTYPGVNLNYENSRYSYIFYYGSVGKWDSKEAMNSVVSTKSQVPKYVETLQELQRANGEIIGLQTGFIESLEKSSQVNVKLVDDNKQNDNAGSGAMGSRNYLWKNKEEIKQNANPDYVNLINSAAAYTAELAGLLQVENLVLANMGFDSELAGRYRGKTREEIRWLTGSAGWFDSKRVAIELQRQLNYLDPEKINPQNTVELNKPEKKIESENEKALLENLSTSARQDYESLVDGSNSPYKSFYRRYFFRQMGRPEVRSKYAQHFEDVFTVGAYKVIKGEDLDRFMRIVNPSVSLFHNGDVLDKFLAEKFRPDNFSSLSDTEVFQAGITTIPKISYCYEMMVISLAEVFDKSYKFYLGEGECTTGAITAAAYSSVCGREPVSMHITSAAKGNAHIVGGGYNTEEKQPYIFDNIAGVGNISVISLNEYLKSGSQWVPRPCNYGLFYPFGPANLTSSFISAIGFREEKLTLPVPPKTVG